MFKGQKKIYCYVNSPKIICICNTCNSKENPKSSIFFLEVDSNSKILLKFVEIQNC